MSAKNKRSLMIYVISDEDFIVTNSRHNVLHKYSLGEEEAIFRYNKRRNQVMLFSDPRDGPHTTIPETYTIQEVHCIPRQAYEHLLAERRSDVQETWNLYRKAAEMLIPYIHTGKNIPLSILKERDKKLAALPQPLSLLQRLQNFMSGSLKKTTPFKAWCSPSIPSTSAHRAFDNTPQ